MSQITNLKIREAVFKFLIQEATDLIIITANLLLQDKKIIITINVENLNRCF